MNKALKFRFFHGNSGKVYKKETDYANRSWWYLREIEYGYCINWSIQNGKPTESMTEITELQAINA